MHIVFLCKTVCQLIPMLIQATHQIIRDADVHNRVIPVGKDIYIILVHIVLSSQKILRLASLAQDDKYEVMHTQDDSLFLSFRGTQ